MQHTPQSSSFSPRQRLTIALRVCLLTAIVLLVLVLANYLSRDHYLRGYWSTRGKIELSSRTRGLLASLTNQVKIILYYDKQEPLYKTVAELANEYRSANPGITVQTVDYLRDAGAAQKVKTEYKLTSATDKNLAIFDCGGKSKVVDGNALTQYAIEQVPDEKERVFRRKPTSFLGELAFTAALLDVTSPKPFVAYFLRGHGEHSVSSAANEGYLKLGNLLQQNYIRIENLSILGTNNVPADCSLLVIAGVTSPLAEPEVEKIRQYLDQGGRLLVLLNSAAFEKETGQDRTGLVKVLAAWGIETGNGIIQDPDNTIRGWDIVVTEFDRQHPLVNPLLQSGLYMVQPRRVGAAASKNQAADAPKVDALAFTGPKAVTGKPGESGRLSVMVAGEKGAVRGVVSERGSARIVVVGDSTFLANGWIDSAANRDFAGYAVNWLLDRTQLLQGMSPKPINEYRMVMTHTQLKAAEWILLGAIPGGVLLLGAIVWLRRRG
jgi:hypothetical protein